MPFSDPMADGPVIQRAGERALAAGMTLAGVLDIAREFRAGDPATPVVFMGYLNPILAMGPERFAEEAAAAGVDGVIVVDMPPRGGEPLLAPLREAGIDPVFLVSPTTSAERMRRIASEATGFLYYVSLKGITGRATSTPGRCPKRSGGCGRCPGSRSGSVSESRTATPPAGSRPSPMRWWWGRRSCGGSRMHSTSERIPEPAFVGEAERGPAASREG